MTNKKKVSIFLLNFLPILNIAVAFILYNKMPDKIPYFWNLNGQPTLFTENAIVIFVIPVLSFLYSVYCQITPYIDPKKINYVKFQNVYYYMTLVIISFITLMDVIYIINIFYPNLLPFIIAIKVFISLTVLFIGNNLPRIKDNNFFGIINPWTRESHYIWFITHRFAARLYFLAGIILLILSFINITAINVLRILIIVSIIIMPHIYSANRYYVKNEKTEEQNKL
jgi:uncharacterized membrane protein